MTDDPLIVEAEPGLDPEPATVEEFEAAYAERWGVTVDELHARGYHADAHNCDEHPCGSALCSGFHMIDPPEPAPPAPVDAADELIWHDA